MPSALEKTIRWTLQKFPVEQSFSIPIAERDSCMASSSHRTRRVCALLQEDGQWERAIERERLQEYHCVG